MPWPIFFYNILTLFKINIIVLIASKKSTSPLSFFLPSTFLHVTWRKWQMWRTSMPTAPLRAAQGRPSSGDKHCAILIKSKNCQPIARTSRYERSVPSIGSHYFVFVTSTKRDKTPEQIFYSTSSGRLVAAGLCAPVGKTNLPGMYL